MKTKSGIHRILRLAIVAALYVVLTVSLSFLSYGDIQFRVAEILILLCFFKKDYGISLVIGCAVANMFSPMGIVDVIFGTIATIISVLFIMKCHNLIIASLFPVIFNGVIIGLELYYVLELPLIMSMISVAIGEAVVVMIFGNLIFFRLRKNEEFMKLIEANQNYEELVN
ncbi:MAG: QueT transporter family protein [Bacilli bacterium]|nr:QueT transporter family protein [Bacilli bacterium]